MKIKCIEYKTWDSTISKENIAEKPKEYEILGFYNNNNYTIAILHDIKTGLIKQSDINNLKII